MASGCPAETTISADSLTIGCLAELAVLLQSCPVVFFLDAGAAAHLKLSGRAPRRSKYRLPLHLKTTALHGCDDQMYQAQAAIQLGALLCDGFGDRIRIDSDGAHLSCIILQAARLHMSKIEFIACPPCGPTLVDQHY